MPCNSFLYADEAARVLTIIVYLNESEWPAEAGGVLRCHLADGVLDVVPRGVRFCVLSQFVLQ